MIHKRFSSCVDNLMHLDIKQVADNWREGFKKHDINPKIVLKKKKSRKK